MITIQSVDDLAKMMNWFKIHQFFPKAMITNIDIDSQEPASNAIRVNFGGVFGITFHGMILDVEDICRCHNDEIAVYEVREKIAAFLMTPELCIVLGTSWDEIDWELKVKINAFAVFFSS